MHMQGQLAADARIFAPAKQLTEYLGVVAGRTGSPLFGRLGFTPDLQSSHM
jgi:hypothetical protein